MIKAFELSSGLSLLILPMIGLAGSMPPPPGGPYPSTVSDEERNRTAASMPHPDQLRFPPPDLAAPAPPPPSLAEKLGPGFDPSGAEQELGAASMSGHAPYEPQRPTYAAPAPQSSRNAAAGIQNYAAPAGATTQPGTVPGASYAYPPTSIGSAWSQPPVSNYSSYGWGNAYPYGYTAPAYGYGYPAPGYAPQNGTWGDTMNTPFGAMPNPWDSMPKSFFPGR